MSARESTLIDRCRVIQIRGQPWFVDKIGNPKGNREKYACFVLDGASQPLPHSPAWHWKASLPRYPLEFWSEVLAYHIGSVMGVQVPPCFPAVVEGKSGALSRSMVDIFHRQFLVHGGDLILPLKPDYDRQRGREHSVQLVRHALAPLRLVGRYYPKLVDQLVLDAILGNGDRHQDNWAFVSTYNLRRKVFKILKLCPAFDNGSSLCREHGEDKVRDMLLSRRALDRYIGAGRAHIRWQTVADGLVQLSHEDLLRRHIETWPEFERRIRPLVQFPARLMERAIRRVAELSRDFDDELQISKGREDFLVELVERRRTRILERCL